MSFLNPPFYQSNGPYYTFLKPLYICTACDVTSIDDPYHYDILALLFLHDSRLTNFDWVYTKSCLSCQAIGLYNSKNFKVVLHKRNIFRIVHI